MNPAALCPFEAPTLLFFSSNVPTLLYFSHFPALFFSLAFAAFILFRSRGRLEARILFFSLLPFALWVFSDLVLFASNRSELVLFLWSILVLIEPLPHFGLWYLQRVMNTGKDISFGIKALMLSLFIPLFIIIGTGVGLPGFDLSICIAVESLYLHYAYILEFFFIVMILFDALRYSYAAKDTDARQKTLYLAGTIILFLLLFSLGNLVGSITDNWVIAQAGLFGAPIFIGLMTFLLSRFQLFNIKVLAAQTLVIVLGGMVFMLLFLRTIDSVRVVTVIALLLVMVLGFILVRNVQREVKAREEIERLAEDLKIANGRLKELDKLKSQFLSMASHDLRAPLTIIRNFISLLLEGAYGKLSSSGEEGLRQVFDRASDMAKSVETYLDVSRIEQGRMKYDFIEVGILPLIENAVKAFQPIAEKKGLVFRSSFDPALTSLKAKVDVAKMNEILNNLLDNTIKYTPKGEISFEAKKDGTNARISIKDTGVGMSADTLKNLFQLFRPGEDSKRINPASTGVGLYITKAHVEAHKGKVWAESAGEGKGSTFIVELPILEGHAV